MPFPKPKKGESKEDYIKRVMEDHKMIEEYPDEKERMAFAKENYTSEEEEKKEMFALDNVEIFEAGTWNGDKYTEDDLDEMVRSFSETRNHLKPYLKLGHSQNQALLQRDGFPSAGWVTELKRQGKKLLAKIENIPEKIYSLIQKKAYGRISSEIFWNLKLNGKNYKRALKAIALLGADTPEVGSLNDFISLYTENYNAELKQYHILEENSMDENRIHELELQIKEYEKKLSEKESAEAKLSEVLKENETLKEYAQKVEYEKKISEISNYLDLKVQEGAITPAQVDYFTALALDDTDIKTYTNKENKKIEGKSFDLVKNIIEQGNPIVNLQENSHHIEVEKKFSKPSNKDDELHEKILSYAKENKVSYDEAFEIIAYEEVN